MKLQSCWYEEEANHVPVMMNTISTHGQIIDSRDVNFNTTNLSPGGVGILIIIKHSSLFSGCEGKSHFVR